MSSLFRQFDDSFSSSRPNTMKPCHEFLPLDTKGLEPWLPQDILPVAVCSSADGEGVSRILLPSSQEQPGSVFGSQDTQVKQTAEMPGWDLSLVLDHNNSKMCSCIWDGRVIWSALHDVQHFLVYCFTKRCLWRSKIVSCYCILNYHFLNSPLKLH